MSVGQAGCIAGAVARQVDATRENRIGTGRLLHRESFVPGSQVRASGTARVPAGAKRALPKDIPPRGRGNWTKAQQCNWGSIGSRSNSPPGWIV